MHVCFVYDYMSMKENIGAHMLSLYVDFLKTDNMGGESMKRERKPKNHH